MGKKSTATEAELLAATAKISADPAPDAGAPVGETPAPAAEATAPVDGSASAETQEPAAAPADAPPVAAQAAPAPDAAEPVAEATAASSVAANAEPPASDPALASVQLAPKPKLDMARLRRLIADIEGHNNPLHRAQLRARLEADEGLVIDERHSAVTTHLAMAGVRTSCTAGVWAGLTNWCSAARRKILAGEAE
ncbi:hypothetical protein D1122_01415 [Cereibacter sphaeroides]|uniref:hypothetical protein n=1 Tax=Cereibacter sphaeroides TaxID=1063 RepID=UPI000E5B3576|nr:hypothetical protein [Cereibacter sphaeroides]RIA01348.1 hypothetical protein D1122_01415 [Cereibacter sphaeroides]